MKKKLLVGLLVVAAAIILSGGIYLTFWNSPPRPPKSLDEAINVVGSDGFLHLSQAQRETYLEQARLLVMAMPEEQRHQLHQRMENDETAQRAFQEAMREFMIQQARMYATVPAAQRTVILDMIIQQQEKGRARHEKELTNLTPAAQQERASRQAKHREDFKKFLRQGNPQMAGLVVEFIKTLNQRRKEKGLVEF